MDCNLLPFTWEYTPRGIYVALCGTNQIEATKVRVLSTNERAGQNPLTEAEGQTRLSLPAMLNVHMGMETISPNVLFYFFLSNIIFSVKAWCGGIDGNFLKAIVRAGKIELCRGQQWNVST